MTSWRDGGRRRRERAAQDLLRESTRLLAGGDVEAAIHHSERAAAILRKLAAEDPETFRRPFGITLLTLAGRLRAAERPEDAGRVGVEAVEVFRAAEAAAPSSSRDRHLLANALVLLADSSDAPIEARTAWLTQAVDTLEESPHGEPDDRTPTLLRLATLLTSAGRFDDATAASGEALARVRARTSIPGAETPGRLLHALLADSHHLAAAGRDAEALERAEEAVMASRPTAPTDAPPDAGDLAAALLRLGGRLPRHRRHDAVTAHRDAVEVLRTHAPEQRGAQAEALHLLAGSLAGADLLDEAVSTGDEATAIAQAVDETQDRAPALADLLLQRARCLGAADDLPGAVIADAEAVASRRSTDPTGSRLVGALVQQAGHLLLAERGDDAGPVTTDALAIARGLPVAAPQHARLLVRALLERSAHLRAIGQVHDALDVAVEARSLVTSSPHLRSQLDRVLAAATFRTVGVLLGDVGRRGDAATTLDQAIATARDEWVDTLHLTPCLAARAIATRREGDATLAVAIDRESVELLQERAPGRTLARRFLATALGHLGESLVAAGDPDGALAASGEGVAIARELVADGAGTNGPTLAAVLTRHGRALTAARRPDEALQAADAAIDLLGPLVRTRREARTEELGRAVAVRVSALRALGRPADADRAWPAAAELVVGDADRAWLLALEAQDPSVSGAAARDRIERAVALLTPGHDLLHAQAAQEAVRDATATLGDPTGLPGWAVRTPPA